MEFTEVERKWKDLSNKAYQHSKDVESKMNRVKELEEREESIHKQNHDLKQGLAIGNQRIAELFSYLKDIEGMVQTLYRGNQETFAVDIQNLSNILTFLPFSTAPIVDLTGSAGGNGHGGSPPGVVPMAMPPRKNYMSPTLHGYPVHSSASGIC